MNRIVRRTQNGYEMEADPRHCELMLKQLDVESLKPLSIPGVEGKDEDGEDDDEFGKAKASEYRGIAARFNYLAAERPDLQYATKEVCREMSAPSSGSWRRRVRIGRYVLGRPRMIWKFDLQEATSQFDTYTAAS